MRRFLLTFTFISFAGWSQPVQPPAQPPIVVRVEMPPANPWLRVVEVVIPGIIGIAGALIAVWFTQRHQRRLEFHKAEIAARYKSHDNRWAFRKDVYVNILAACDALANSLVAVAEMQRVINSKSPGYESLLPLQQQNMSNIVRNQGEFSKYALWAPLAMADDVAPLVQLALKQLAGGNDLDDCDALTSKTMMLLRLTAALQTAGRKDLWGMPEPEPKAESNGHA